MDVDSRLRQPLDESKLLILGAQVLFGFQFAAVVQERFPGGVRRQPATPQRRPGADAHQHQPADRPSLFHQIIFRGDGKPAAIEAATWLTGASLLPLTLAPGIAAFMTFDHLFRHSP